MCKSTRGHGGCYAGENLSSLEEYTSFIHYLNIY
jgi:hypothetical protein